MKLKYKFVRFQEWSSATSASSEGQFTPYRRGTGAAINGILARIRGWRKSLSLPSRSGKQSKEWKKSPRRKILDPQDPFLQGWTKAFLVSTVLAVALDPFFFYIPVLHRPSTCLDLDSKLAVITCVFRSIIDAFYILHIIFQFRTGFIAPSSRVFGKGELVESPSAIAKRYLCSYFFIDILSILPFPQLVVLLAKHGTKGLVSLRTKDWLEGVIIGQYVPRLLRMIPLYKDVTTTSGIITQTAWIGAAINLCLYMLASHVVGSIWYLIAVERQDACWVQKKDLCNLTLADLYCSSTTSANITTNHQCLNDKCPINPDPDVFNATNFNFGIFLDALQSQVVEKKEFKKKFFYCLWWGLRNLSSLGQNLKTSTFTGEIFFAVFISIFGLVLFSSLIGNMQKYLQSTTVRLEEMRVRRQDAEQWMAHRMLPGPMRERIRRYEQYKWQETRGVEEHKLISDLPKDLRRDIRRHLCLDLVTRVPMFEKMDSQLLDAMCDHLKPVLYTENSIVLREGDPVDEMFFIMRGKLSTITTNGGRTGFFNETYLKAGDFCGDELLTWVLESKSSSSLPISTRTVKAITEVEAFRLMSRDLKNVASQFFYRLHSKQLQYTFRFYSQQWRTWAACFIQTAWQRYRKRKQDKALLEAEQRLQDALSREVGACPSLSATVFASRFAAKLLRGLRRNGGQHRTRFPQRLPPLMPQKPTDPEFPSEGR